jgi:hypothetical protein
MKRLGLIINWRTALVTLLAVASTWFCVNFEIKANFPITLLVTAVVFPVVFSIHSAYERRERVLQDYASLKSLGRAMYLATRDWLQHTDNGSLKRLERELGELLSNCVHLLSSPQSEREANELAVYGSFSSLSHFIRQEHRDRGMAETELSRINQYLSGMLNAFESIKHIYQYRTPQTLKVFGNFFLMIVPPVYGPLFAYMTADYSNGLEYVMPVMIAVVLTALVNIQEQLENPFDQYGEDDVIFNVDKFIASLRAGGPLADTAREPMSLNKSVG